VAATVRHRAKVRRVTRRGSIMRRFCTALVGNSRLSCMIRGASLLRIRCHPPTMRESMSTIDARPAAPFATAAIAPEKRSELQALVDSRRPGFSLTAPFYTDRQLFDLDMRAVFGRHW